MTGRPRYLTAQPRWRERSRVCGSRAPSSCFLRVEDTEAWAYDSLPPRDALAVLAPGAWRVILFPVIASGRAWIETYDGERH